MADDKPPENPVEKWVSGVVAGATPSSIKAINKLLGALVDYPVAWIERWTTAVRGKTESIAAIDKAITTNAVSAVASDSAIAKAAIANLARKEYQRVENKAAIVVEALQHVKEQASEGDPPNQDIDDDWLNVFERYAEDASSDRLRSVWARVLSGEIRKSGTVSIRTLRFLSEFSKEDADLFAKYCNRMANSILLVDGRQMALDAGINDLLELEAAGLIQDAAGQGTEQINVVDVHNYVTIKQNSSVLVVYAPADTKISVSGYPLTKVASDLLSIADNYDDRAALRNYWNATSPKDVISKGLLGKMKPAHEGKFTLEEQEHLLHRH